MINLLVIGDSHTGKTSLITTFCNGFAPEPYEAFDLDIAYQHKSLEFSSKSFNLQIWDAQNCHSLAQEPFTSAEGVLLVFSMSDRASFDSVRESWMEIIHRDLGQDICVVLLGNVYENENSVVSSNEVRMLAEECRIRYYEVDVRKSEQVEETFMGLLSQVEARKDMEREEQEYSGNIHAYMNAFKAEMFAYMEEIRRRDREEMEMRLRRVERQVRNKSQGVLEVNNRISEVEYNEEVGDDSMNASVGEAQDFAQKTVDEEVVELKRKVEELEEKLTRNFCHLDNKIKTANSDIGDLNHRVYSMTQYCSRQSPSQEAVYADPRVGELRVPRSENLDDNHSNHQRRGSTTPSWKKKFNLTIATPDSSSSPKDQNLRGLSEDGFRQFKAKAQTYITENQTRINGASRRFNTHIDHSNPEVAVRSANPSPHPHIKILLPNDRSQTPQGGDSSFNDAHSLMRLDANAPSTQDEIALIWKTINTIIENTQEQIERLRVSTVNIAETPAAVTARGLQEGALTARTIQEEVLRTERTERKFDENIGKDNNKEDNEEKNSENNQKKQIQDKDLKTVIREVKDDVHNQILGVHREVERELNTLRDTLLGHYSVFSEKIHLENEGLRKYVDEKIEDIINEMHHAMMINQPEKQVEHTERDRAMSECTILRRPNQPLQDFDSDILIVDKDSGERLNLTQSLVEQNKKQIQIIQEESVKSIWETIGMIASRLTKVERNVITSTASTAGSILLK